MNSCWISKVAHGEACLSEEKKNQLINGPKTFEKSKTNHNFMLRTMLSNKKVFLRALAKAIEIQKKKMWGNHIR